MAAGRNLIREMTATGGVNAESHAGANTRTLKTDALRVEFAADAKSATIVDKGSIDKQEITSAETLGPATIETKGTSNGDGQSAIQMKAAKFVAEFGRGSKLERLLGHSGVQITRTPATGPPETSKAAELTATFDTRGEWTNIDETGNVALAQGARQVKAGHAHVEQATGAITLDGSPVFSDGATRTSAATVMFNQKTGEIRASGGVVSTQMAAGRGKSPSPSSPASSPTLPFSGTAGQISLGEGDAHISADSLSGSSTTGDATFQGHAKLWQGQAVLNADQVSLSQKEGNLAAVGNVVAVFPQQAGQGPAIPAVGRGKTPSGRSEAVLWQVRAQRLGYSNGEGVAHLEGGVTASSQQGSLHSQTLDVYFAPSAPGAGAPAISGAGAGRGLSRAVAQGNVTVAQGEIRGRAERAEYDATQGRFVLSGGKPTITDGNGNTTTGHSLTFDVASDTISIVSDEGSRTLTRHRVEK
jgi:lipopolysaccharide export system protein LptA